MTTQDGSTTIVNADFVYQVSYLLRRGTKTYSTWLKASTPAVIRSPSSDEAAVAFRLLYWRPPENWVRKETEIVAYDGKLYWPIHRFPIDNWRTRESFSQPDESITAEHLIGLLQGDGPLFATRGDLINFWHSKYNLEGKTVGTWLGSERDHKSAEVQRKVFENLMIWRGRAYARGGPPVYAERPLGQGFFDTGIGNPGHDRSVDPTADMPWDLGRNYWCQEAIATGNFQRADEYKIAKKIHSKYHYDGEGGRIKVMVPAFAEIAREELQLDAAFRVCLRMLRDGTIDCPPLKKMFAEVAAKDHRLPNTSKDRLAALRAIMCHWDEDERHAKMKYLDRWVYDALTEFLSTAAAKFEREELCEADEEAVTGLAT